VRPQDIGIVRIHQRVLEIPLEKEVRVAHQILVEGIVRPIRKLNDCCLPLPLRRPAARRWRCCRVSGQYCCFQIADVDAQFQCVGSDNSQQFPREQVALDLPSVLCQVTGAVG